ncbi:TGS domain-containing protein, partial [candidate division KSB1 bacterium]|nr:TGS domain-containing protein [candidate division KSB1 bacterium]
MHRELNRWIEKIFCQIPQVLAEYAPLYSNAVNLTHYRRLAMQLLDRFGDLALAQAAFLHGLPSGSVFDFFGDRLQEPVVQIMEDRELLASLDGRDADVAQQLVTDVIPALRDWRSVPLFLFDKLDHLDWEGTLFNWTLRFYQSPVSFDRTLYQPMHYRCSITDPIVFSAFCRSVLVKTADYFGLWHERNVLENAALLLSDSERFQALVDLVREEVATPTLTHLLCAEIQKVVGSGRRVGWEWRHIGAIDRELGRDGNLHGSRALHKWGYIAVMCPNAADCYHVLGVLHRHFSHRPSQLHDYIGECTNSGYRAIHTVLIVPRPPKSISDVIPIRLIPEDQSGNRFLTSDKQKEANVRRRFVPEAGGGVRVFTPDGRRVELPMGGTVLHFALTVHGSFVAYLRGATVNRQPVSVLHPLDWGDVVWLDISDTPQPLPIGWQDRF